MSYRGFLAELLMAECDDRTPSLLRTPRQRGCIPAREVVARLRLRSQSQHRPSHHPHLATCQWVEKGLPLCLICDSGTGKSRLLIVLGTAAAMAGSHYTLATKLVNE